MRDHTDADVSCSALQGASRLNRRDFLAAPLAGAIASGLNSLALSAWAIPNSDPAHSLPPAAALRRRQVVSSRRTFESGFLCGPADRFDQFDAEDTMRRIRATSADCVSIQTKSMWGYAFYDTVAGVRHPALTYDLVSRMLEAAHRNGLAAFAYYSGQVDVQSALAHPDWMGLNADGKPSWFGEQFPWCCHHSPYGEYARKMYAEIFSRYDFDGLFIDGAPWPRWFGDALCYCPWCKARYLQDAAVPMATSNSDPRAFRHQVEWFQNCSARFLDEIAAIVHERRPGLPIWFNQGDPLDMPDSVLRKSASLYLEPLSSPTGLSAASILLRGAGIFGAARDDNPEASPTPQVGIFWNGYTSDPIEMDLYRTSALLLQGARPRLITDEQNMPDGRQRQPFFDWVSRMNGHIEQIEPHLGHLTPLPSIGIFFSQTTRDFLRDTGRFRSSMIGGDFLPSLLGCVEILTQTGYPVDFASSTLAADSLSRFDLIVLPETEALSDVECEAIHQYVRKGGRILATFKPGLHDDKLQARSDFGLAKTLGVSYLEEVTRYAGTDGPGIYLQTNGHPLSSFLGLGEVGILGKGIQPQQSYSTWIRIKGVAESILDYCPPYLVPDLAHHIFHGWNPAPPGNERIPMAATVYRCGAGTAVYAGVPLFRRYAPDLYWIADWVKGLVARLVPDPQLRVAGSAAVHASFWQQGTRRLVVQVANSLVWTSHGSASALRGLEIVGRTHHFSPATAQLVWPKEQALRIVPGAAWRIPVPDVALHSIVAIDLA